MPKLESSQRLELAGGRPLAVSAHAGRRRHSVYVRLNAPPHGTKSLMCGPTEDETEEQGEEEKQEEDEE